MDYRFNSEEWKRLSVQDRIRRCRTMADEATKLADSAPVKTQAEAYLAIAQNWLRLAEEMANQD